LIRGPHSAYSYRPIARGSSGVQTAAPPLLGVCPPWFGRSGDSGDSSAFRYWFGVDGVSWVVVIGLASYPMVRQPSESCPTLVVADIILYRCHRARCVAVSGPMGPILPPVGPILRWFWPDISRTTTYLAHQRDSTPHLVHPDPAVTLDSTFLFKMALGNLE
jgi:hypothetical protein